MTTVQGRRLVHTTGRPLFALSLYICAAADAAAAAAFGSSPGRESSVAEGGSEGGNHSN